MPASCKTILASTVSASFRYYFGTPLFPKKRSDWIFTSAAANREQIKKDIQERKIRPKLVGFLANEDPAAKKYAEWTAKTCAETGVEFELRKVDKQQLEQKITEANEEKEVNGIMVYYPVFGGKQVKKNTCTFLLMSRLLTMIRICTCKAVSVF